MAELEPVDPNDVFAARGRNRVDLRLFREVERMMAIGLRFHEILRALEQGWEKVGLRRAPSRSIVHRYIQKVYEGWAAHTTANSKHERARVLRTIEQAMQIAFAEKDTRAIASLVREQARIQGMYAPQVVDLRGGMQVETSAETRGALARLLQELGGYGAGTSPQPPIEVRPTNGHTNGTNGTNGAKP